MSLTADSTVAAEARRNPDRGASSCEGHCLSCCSHRVAGAPRSKARRERTPDVVAPLVSGAKIRTPGACQKRLYNRDARQTAAIALAALRLPALLLR